MRFNDLFATVLSGHAESEWSRATLWRQCLDLLAQYGEQAGAGEPEGDGELTQVAARLEGLRDSVSTEQKLAALRDLGGRLRSVRLVRLLMREPAPVQVAVMGRARLPDGEWPALIAEAGPLPRSILRQRADLGPEARRALDAFGLSDLSLIDLNAEAREEEPLLLSQPAPQAAAEPAPVQERGPDQSQIRRIVDRIERFTSERQDRTRREADGADPDDGREASELVSAFTFLTDTDGTIQTADGAPRMQLSGLRLATPSLDRSVGPDGQILGAFRRRGAFREGRLTIGEGPLAGCWLVDGDPLFDQRTGRFIGYRGAARRAVRRDLAPRTGEAAQTVAGEEGHAAHDASHATSMRQLIHELRSPLSGVMGFAELIESQLLGPVSDGYRSMAGNIVDDVRTLVDILDDLDLANRTDRLAAPVGAQGSDAELLLRAAIDRHGRDADGQERVALEVTEPMPAIDVAPAIAERMIAHFVQALSGCAGAETLVARSRREDGHLLMEIDRPVAMAGLSDEQLFDAGFEHVAVNLDAPVLGVGFALRLVRRLAQANRGAFTVHPGHFTLALPIPAQTAEQEASS
ncbi:MAG: histidine kinase dimerization/phospho-acceptor domain-containing protein [Sphingobium sp.]